LFALGGFFPLLLDHLPSLLIIAFTFRALVDCNGSGACKFQEMNDLGTYRSTELPKQVFRSAGRSLADCIVAVVTVHLWVFLGSMWPTVR
jgi:hypothetical protein